ncbi:uncharacterized protein PHACADRAFT_201135 [Phanerochaete carnosa HHB-10118-sp]|uniref:Uncharacterized protein n=1 Tax=Phanerochaete carnosa (strain HHB-10118-sp) TaxID=650164 RepID=K5UL04_PHACS|nr:uncharacterized protein PHACADRAFT_201135 [Phanerochaete carnosa HHB-10118-sp]EKM50296.1 hypothetical protein PHACADRAFT_201135 [Phanerochaete carnosa HHB-10118-sp]
MSDVHAQKESERDRVRAEPFGTASGDDGYATESDVEEDDQSGDKESGYGGDDDSDDAQNQLLPVRRRVSPPPEHREYHVVSPPPTFLQNRVLVGCRMSPNRAAKHAEATMFGEGLIQRYLPLANSRRNGKQ